MDRLRRESLWRRTFGWHQNESPGTRDNVADLVHARALILRFVREPLLHFFVLGAGIFAANAWLNDTFKDRHETRAKAELVGFA
jgi:hypothetical protein